ncbi:ComEC/Rec2 family competence protein [Candidatus Woesebacteria bacterium]|nr:ComEC/Rec2 family competence protein [Candidatus Woesebacteria bacterium]
MEAIIQLINSYFHEPYASLLNGMVVGKKLHTTKLFYDQIKTAGLLHLVVLSGMNISLLTAILMNTLAGLFHRKIATIITICVIVGFIYAVGAEPPIIRAGIMGILALTATFFGRNTLALYSLFLSAIIMLLVHFEWLYTISFQLSFGATLGIILFGNISSERKEKQKKEKNMVKKYITDVVKYFREELRISLAAQIFTLPLIFIYFREISLVAPLANILVGWTVAPITIIGIIVIFIGLISWKIGFVLSWLLYPMLWWMVLVIGNVSKIPFGFLRLY